MIRLFFRTYLLIYCFGLDHRLYMKMAGVTSPQKWSQKRLCLYFGFISGQWEEVEMCCPSLYKVCDPNWNVSIVWIV